MAQQCRGCLSPDLVEGHRRPRPLEEAVDLVQAGEEVQQGHASRPEPQPAVHLEEIVCLLPKLC